MSPCTLIREMKCGSWQNVLHSNTWRSVFYVSAGIAALIAVGGALTVDSDQPSEEKDKRVDWIGSLLITSGLVLIIFVLSDGGIAPQGWRTPCKYKCSSASSADPHNLGTSGLEGLTLSFIFDREQISSALLRPAPS